VSDRILYVFTLTARKRRKPNPRYDGVLRTHRFYAEYYFLLADEDPAKPVLSEPAKPLIAFPAKYDAVLYSFAELVGGEEVYRRTVYLPSTKSNYVKRVIGFRNEVDFKRHLLFTLVASTLKKQEKLNTLQYIVANLNPIFVNILANIAIDRYRELSGYSARPYYILRVGRALKVLYWLDRGEA